MATTTSLEQEFIERLLREFASLSSWECESLFTISGHGIRVVGDSQNVVDMMTRALQHVRAATIDRADLAIEVWSGTHEPFFNWVRQVFGERVMRIQTKRYRCLYNPGIHKSIPRLSFFDRESGRAIFWIPDMLQVPWYEVAAPFRTIFHWFFRQHGIFLVHGASIGMGPKGVLLVGKGGSGKSSTALTAFSQPGLSYVGDDYVLVSLSSQPSAMSLYSSAKITEQSLLRFNCFADTPVRVPGDGEEKVVLFPCEQNNGTCVLNLPISAIALPVVSHREHTSWEKMHPAHALLALAPSTIFQLRPEDTLHDSFEALATLVKNIPSYRITLGKDEEEVGHAMKTFLTTI